MLKIKGKKFCGYNYVDEVHWHWGDEEVAIINRDTREIEWCNRLSHFPQEVIDAVRERKPKPIGEWTIKVKPVKVSATQCYVNVLINDEVIISWGEECAEGKWKLHNLGEYVTSLLYHEHDELYHYSDRVKKAFEG